MTETEPTWEEVEVPRGAYISWGNTTGQHITGALISYDEVGGTDFNGNVCPQLAIELTAPGASINKEGVRTDFPAGELVVLNIGLVSLKRAIRAAQLSIGDLVKIELVNLVKTQNGTVKEFSIKVARGAGKGAVASSPPPAATPAPPF